MPIRTIPLVSGEYYHVYNRGVAHQPTFLKKKDYERFLLCLRYYQYNPPLKLSRCLQISLKEREKFLTNIENQEAKIVDIIAYCLMPNHFHILIKQNKEDGISKFLRLSINSYARYFNTKYKRVGTLFQGMFKAIHIETEEQLLHLSRYI